MICIYFLILKQNSKWEEKKKITNFLQWGWSLQTAALFFKLGTLLLIHRNPLERLLSVIDTILL
jgi:hypothetical protein